MLKVFEFHFQINNQKGKVFDSFCYEPENIREKKSGNLYIVGEVNNTTIQNAGLLDDLAQNIKTKFYGPLKKRGKSNPEKNLKESLKAANIFLQDKIKEGETGLPGNLSLAVLNLILSERKWELNFAKTGEVKIFLIREEQVSDISQNLESNKKNTPSSFIPISKNKILAAQKFFGDIATGQLSENDRIAVLTREIFPVFEKENILEQIAELMPQTKNNHSPFEKKKLNKILKKYKNVLYKNSGVFLFIALENQINETPLSPSKLKEQKEIFEFKPSKINARISSLRDFLFVIARRSPVPYGSGRSRSNLIKGKGLLRRRSAPPRNDKGDTPRNDKKDTLLATTVKKINIIINRFILAKQKICKFKQLIFSKNFVLIIVFILLLALGSFIFKQEKEKEIQKTEQHLEEIKTKISQAESFLIIKKQDEARILLQDAWKEVLPLTAKEMAMSDTAFEEALSIKKSIEAQLDTLNKIERIDEPITVEDGTEPKILSIRKKYNLAAPWKNSILAFVKPNRLLKLKNDAIEEEIILENALSDFEPVAFSIYYSNLYFLDSASGRIIKYPHSKNLEWGKPKIWLEKELLNNAKSMAIDGSVWVLNSDNKIDRYYAGEYKETLKLNFFPEIENPTQIWTSPALPELYILEPSQKRIIILDKNPSASSLRLRSGQAGQAGEIVKQFISEKFDNLLDFAVSANGKTIYLLNRAKIYKIEM